MTHVRLLTPAPYELTYDDVFLLPHRSAITSRLEVETSTSDGSGTTIPVVVANMTSVAGRRMAETVARRGAIAVIPQDIPIDVVSDVISFVKSRHVLFDTAITLGRNDTVGVALGLLPKRAHGAVVVIEDGRPVGVVTEADCLGVDRFTQVHEVMSRDLLTLPDTVDPRAAFDRLQDGRHRLAPVVDGQGRLVGILTREAALRSGLYAPAVDAKGGLRIAAATGVSGDVETRAKGLLAAGVDVLVLDTAHGHQERMIDALQTVRALDPQVPIVAGNVVTADGVRDLVAAGADILKVGVGPGAMCTTRMMTGVGRPQFSAVLECAAEARRLGTSRLGRRRRPPPPRRSPRACCRRVERDDRLLARGHPRVTRRCPARPRRPALQGELRDGVGPCGTGAHAPRTPPSSGLARPCSRRASRAARMYLDPARPGVEDLLDTIVAGLRSACTYAGARDPRAAV